MQKIIGFFGIIVIGVVLAAAELRPQRTGPSSNQMLSFQRCLSAKRENHASVKKVRIKVNPDSEMNPAFAFDEDFARNECKEINNINPADF